jgi:hypothetical protein
LIGNPEVPTKITFEIMSNGKSTPTPEIKDDDFHPMGVDIDWKSLKPDEGENVCIIRDHMASRKSTKNCCYLGLLFSVVSITSLILLFGQ